MKRINLDDDNILDLSTKTQMKSDIQLFFEMMHEPGEIIIDEFHFTFKGRILEGYEIKNFIDFIRTHSKK